MDSTGNCIYLYKNVKPTVLRTKGYSFCFYINDHTLIPMHIEKERSTAKFDLINAELIKSRRFNVEDIAEIRKLVVENIELFKSKWNEYINLK